MFFSKKQTETTTKPILHTILPSPFVKSRDDIINDVIDKSFPVKPVSGATQDFLDPSISAGHYFGQSISETNISWFGSRGFPGYQALAIMAQHWLIGKACLIPCADAVRKGWEITKNDGKVFDNLQDIQRLDKKHKIHEKLVSFANMGRVYGIRVAVFLIDNDDPDYYKMPFNIDSVKPGSFKGIIANDPYYVIPDISQQNQNPLNPMFYEPEYWVINGKKIHHSHCVVFRHREVPQILKPSYIYGGISLTQEIFEAAYNAEISANEIPMLIQNMRMDVLKTDLAQALMNPNELNAKLQDRSQVRSNWGVNLIGIDDDLTQIQTTLTGLDELVQGRYKLVASVAEMPVAKLLKTDLTGGLVKGGGEEAIYHETLESLQRKMLPFLEKYYQLLLASEFGYKDNIDIVFNKLDAMTEKELAELNKIKADTHSLYTSIGAIDGQDVRDAIIQDEQSGYNRLESQAPEMEQDEWQ